MAKKMQAAVDFAGGIWQPAVVVILLYLLLFSLELNKAGKSIESFAALIASITFILFIVAEVLAKYVYYSGNFFPIKKKEIVSVYALNNEQAGISWLVAFIAFLALTGGAFNVLGFGSQSVFSEAASTVTDPIISWCIVNIFAPVAEESFFLIGLPLIIFGAFAVFSRDFKFLQNKWLQIVVVALVVSPIFALFHIQSQALLAFVFVAALFRSVIIFGVWGDKTKNVIPIYAASYVSAVGAHMANNINSTGGLVRGFQILLSSPLGWAILLIFFALPTFFATQFILKRLKK